MSENNREQPPAGQAIEVRLTAETIAYLNEQVRLSVAEGISDAMTKENAKAFWAAGLEVLRDEAEDHAGRFVIGGLWGLARKLSMFLFLGGIVYALGGWTALARLWSLLFHGAT